MEITQGNGPILPGGGPNRRPEHPDSARPNSRDAIHKEHLLRETVNRLMESGDLSVAEDGSVRQDRVDDVRRKLESGTYDQDDVISGIVDRLLQQWKI